MNREAWQHIVQEARNGNEALFNKAFTSNFQEHFYKAIHKIVQDESLTREIYNSTMLKFWERFVLMGEDLPESNIDGYIYQMSRNAFYELRRQKTNQRNLNTVYTESQEIIEKYTADTTNYNRLEVNENQGEEMKKEDILHHIINGMNKNCQEIIKRNMLQGVTLVKVKEEIALYGSYNAIVQKKKRCMNVLSKRLKQAFRKKKYNLTVEYNERH